MPTKTVFVLGAGASIPYGFPSGSQLVEQIIESISPSFYRGGEEYYTKKPLADLLVKEFSSKELINFRETLNASQTYSIDAFLNYRREFIDIGKMAIVWHLLEAEYKALKGKKMKGDWYQFFWNQINSHKEDLYSFSFYTFNYDRSLEYFLRTSAANLYGYKGVDLNNYLAKIPINHLHGTLGNMKFGHKSSIVTAGELSTAADNIKIIFEVDEMTMFEQFQDEVRKCDNIVFLGFGFHPDNIKRIGFPRIKFFPKRSMPKIFSSAYGLKEVELYSKLIKHLHITYNVNFQREVDEHIHDLVEVGSETDANLEFLRKHFPFEELFVD